VGCECSCRRYPGSDDPCRGRSWSRSRRDIGYRLRKVCSMPYSMLYGAFLSRNTSMHIGHEHAHDTSMQCVRHQSQQPGAGEEVLSYGARMTIGKRGERLCHFRRPQTCIFVKSKINAGLAKDAGRRRVAECRVGESERERGERLRGLGSEG
jgi:hypothetical protein